MMIELIITFVAVGAGYAFGFLNGRSVGREETHLLWAQSLYEAADSNGHVDVQFQVKRYVIEDDE